MCYISICRYHHDGRRTVVKDLKRLSNKVYASLFSFFFSSPPSPLIQELRVSKVTPPTTLRNSLNSTHPTIFVHIFLSLGKLNLLSLYLYLYLCLYCLFTYCERASSTTQRCVSNSSPSPPSWPVVSLLNRVHRSLLVSRRRCPPCTSTGTSAGTFVTLS